MYRRIVGDRADTVTDLVRYFLIPALETFIEILHRPLDIARRGSRQQYAKLVTSQPRDDV